jgi:hypothetical protein
MRGVYTVNTEASGVVAAKTLLFVQAPPNRVLEIYSACVSNKTNETNEQCECVFQKITSFGVPIGINAIISPHETGDQASTAIASGNLTANEPTYATKQYGKEGIPSLGGWKFDPIPECRITLAPSEAAGIRILNAPASLDLNISCTYREIG